ncbi:MAG: copper chaperone PCu(A)C [Woeseia sp.]
MILQRLSIALCCAVLTACSPTPEGVLVTEAYGFVPTGNNSMAVAYLTLHNNTKQDVHIENVHSALFENATFHETVLHDGHARMRALPAVSIRPGEKLELEPGAIHLMLMQPQQTITAGTVDTLTFNFTKHAAVIARVEFFARNAPPPMHEDTH